MFVHHWDLVGLEVLLQLLLDDVVSIREFVEIPQVNLPLFSIIYLNLNLPLLGLLLIELSVITIIGVDVFQFSLERDVPFELLCDEVHLKHLREVLRQFILDEILLLDAILLDGLLVFNLLLLSLSFLGLLLLLLLELSHLFDHLSFSLSLLD